MVSITNGHLNVSVCSLKVVSGPLLTSVSIMTGSLQEQLAHTHHLYPGSVLTRLLCALTPSEPTYTEELEDRKSLLRK